MPAVRLVGAPGVGKTAFAEALAEANAGRLVILNGHRWVSVEETHGGVDPATVAGVVAGIATPEDARLDGALTRAARIAQTGKLVVLLLDEWDKTMPAADALLYDFLQSARVVLPTGEVMDFPAPSVIVVMTTNGFRPLAEPLLRRCFRIEFRPLPPRSEADLLRKMTGAPPGACRAVVRAMNAIRMHGETTPSVQEGANLLRTLLYLRAQGVRLTREALAEHVRGWLVKEPADEEALGDIGRVAATIWGEVCR